MGMYSLCMGTDDDDLGIGWSCSPRLVSKC